MTQVEITTKEDYEEVLKLNRRRQFEEERKKRIFNTKQRILGVDLDGLQRQVVEKALKNSQQHEDQCRHEEYLLCQDLTLCAKDHDQEKQKRAIQADINFYRRYYQRQDQRREYDLSDPQALRHAQPARTADFDPELGVSSAQIFDGEDLSFDERRRRQTEQQRAWLDQQILERKKAELSKQQAERQWSDTVNEHESCLGRMATAEQCVRARMLDAVQSYNKILAQQKRAERERIKQEKMEDDLAEIYNMLTSDMLTENPAVAQSSAGLHRRIPYLYRGMTAAERTRCHQELQRQKACIDQRLTEAKMVEKQWEEQALSIDHDLKLKEVETERRRKGIVNELGAFNNLLAAKQRTQNEQNDKEFNTNFVTDQFFAQFNTTSR